MCFFALDDVMNGAFIVNFEQYLLINVVFTLLTLRMCFSAKLPLKYRFQNFILSFYFQ